ncbi:hypothetical protein DICVIV_06319 [Dictyocaulus viviparus]|uniref:Peptidase M3A/M3B catalytic domain-containing protein n=1 Tax=Dictyocaulus viviparus TaxID=29172 RepID=A0A0D8XUV1_DICVI|nr:hypothetical protein DICVIV_06319 [Dictyocaulus viviparus]
MATNDQHVFMVTDPKMLKDAPPHVLQKLAVEPTQWEEGPWRGRMTPHTLYPFIQYCENRQLRAEAWEKWTNKRRSTGLDESFSILANISQIDRYHSAHTWLRVREVIFLVTVGSDARGLDKLVYLIGSAIAPTQALPSLLHHQQLQQLLFHVGRALQMLLSRSPYRDIAIPWAPFYASDWDAADAFPTFLQFFVYKPTLLQSLGSPHVVNGTTISDDAANNICLALSRATLWDSYRTLFWSDLDLTIFEMEDRR